MIKLINSPKTNDKAADIINALNINFKIIEKYIRLTFLAESPIAKKVPIFILTLFRWALKRKYTNKLIADVLKNTKKNEVIIATLERNK
jgi:predicted transcriptional regulator